jgi:hypothetical protein
MPDLGATNSRAKILRTKIITLENPTSSENFGIFGIDEAITIDKIVAVVKGSSSPSVTFNIKHGTDRSASGTSLFSSDQTCSSTTTGTTYNSGFNDNTIDANAWLWLTTSATAGTVTQITLIIYYT